MERELPPVPSGIVMADYDAVYSSEDDEGEYDGEYVVWNDEAAYEDDGAEDDVGAHRPSCSRTATSRVVAPLSEGGLKIDNVEFDVLCRRATTRTNIPWPQGDVETVQEGDIFDGLRATVRTAPKQLTPLLPSTLREAKLSWTKPLTSPHNPSLSWGARALKKWGWGPFLRWRGTWRATSFSQRPPP